MLIWVVSFRIYARCFDTTYAQADKSVDIHQAGGYLRLIGRMVAKVEKIAPWTSRCLVGALTVKFLLRRFKIANEMLIGVAMDNKHKLSAHAWVNVFEITAMSEWLMIAIAGE